MKESIINKNFLDELNKLGLLHSCYKENAILNHQIYNKNNNISVLNDLEYYKELVSNIDLFFDYNPLIKQRVKNVRVTPSVCAHTHKYAPANNFLAISYELLDENDKRFYRVKFSPYYFKHYDRVEINVGVVFKNPFDIYTLGNHKKVFKHYTLAKVTNLSPSHLYIYAIDNMFFKNGLDPNHIGYDEDMKGLKEYSNKINQRFSDLHLNFNENGIISYNKKYKIRDIYQNSKDIPLNFVSSYYIKHE
jgi:hypothetical protein